MDVFERLESNVRGYCRQWPTVFVTAKGAQLFDEQGRRYIDFFAGAGALNYGHNPPELKERLIEYLVSDGIAHGLDMMTAAKRELLLAFEQHVLEPRDLHYRVQFPGPTGTNAVEAALKLARKVTQRPMIVGFTHAFHGMTLGSLSVTGNGAKRAGAGVPLGHSVMLPYAGYMSNGADSIAHIEALLADPSSGYDKPAAVIVETIQAEGGINVASRQWLRSLRELTRRHEILLIVDDIQVGCGRTGPFFSFEETDIDPDIVCLSKSLSGYGLPLSMVLLKPELDAWAPGEHNGTFRGHNPAFVTAKAALEQHWSDATLSRRTVRLGRVLRERLAQWAARFGASARGRGLIQGLELPEGAAAQVARQAFEHGVLIETAGAHGEVLKFLPPLTIDEALFEEGLDIVGSCLERVMTRRARRASTPPELNAS